MYTITDDTPIAMLTVGQLREVLGSQEPMPPVLHHASQITPSTQKIYVYGLRGIAELFSVSRVTAQRYKDTFLKPSIIQNGKKIMIERDRAMELFKLNQQPII